MPFYKDMRHKCCLGNNVCAALLYCHDGGIIQGMVTHQMHLVTKLWCHSYR